MRLKQRSICVDESRSVKIGRPWEMLFGLAALLIVCTEIASQGTEKALYVLQTEPFHPLVEHFNTMEDENVTNCIPNARSWNWLEENIPFFECPDEAVQEIYYYRWWSFRKHLKCTSKGHVLTEFLTPVGHAGEFNTVSCAAGHHIDEGRWLRNRKYLDDYVLYWLRGANGAPQPHFHKFSSWFPTAVYNRYLVNQDLEFVVGLLPDLVADYEAWEAERQWTNGLFWQFDVRDGMEESISGSRRVQQARPTINSYMIGNATALQNIAVMAGDVEIAKRYENKAAVLRELTLNQLWNPEAQFFEVVHPENGFSDVREEIGFIPWLFGVPDPDRGYERAWAQLIQPDGFRAPFGITTAERRHPDFRTHGVGTCEWDGAVWPFATSQTLGALATVIRDYPQSYVTEGDYFDAFITYVISQYADGKPYIGEYLDEVTGDWINGRGGRSRYYNHSTFADLLITGVAGLRPRADDVVEVHPLLPEGTWDWFCIDGVAYHGCMLTILWDRNGDRYARGKGLRLFADGIEIAQADTLQRVTGNLP